MEENIVCRFCLKILGNQNFDIVGDVTLEILKILSIGIDLGIDEKSLMCRNCKDTIDRCFNFKSTCISSEDSIAEYITEDSKLDIEEVYLTVKLEAVPKGYKICRLCIKIATTACCLTTIDELFALTSNKLGKCIPEVNLYLVKQPVICEACLVDLQSYYEFVTCCLDVEKKINRYCKAKGVDKRQVQLYNVLQFILNEALESNISKCAVPSNPGKLGEDLLNVDFNRTGLSAVQFDYKIEKIEIKMEDEKKSCSNKRINGNSETGVTNGDQVQCTETDQFIKNDNINCDKRRCDSGAEDIRCSLLQKISLPRRIKVENEDENQSQVSTKHNFKKGGVAEICIKNEEIEIKSGDMGDPKDCDYQDNSLPQNNTSHKKKHNANGQTTKRVFCEICSTTYSNKQALAEHKLHFHGAGPEIVYECEECSFKTRYRKNLSYHKKVHMSLSESKMHKCKECEFKTKYKNNLKAHSLARHQDLDVLIFKKHLLPHKNNSEVQIFSCNVCPYKTIDKRHMKYHEMTHKDISELATYDCFHCPYKAKRKETLRRHMLTPKTLRELIPHKSDKCGLISQDKSYVSSNSLVHKKKSLNKINIRTRHRDRPKKHTLIQIDSSNLKNYKCEICPFQATSRINLKRHLLTLTHSEAPSATYKCMHCSFQTSSRQDFKQHLQFHNGNSFSELPTFKCLLCAYRTANKQTIERHVKCHKKSSATELWKCKICDGEYNKFHVKKHQRMCVGPDCYNGESINKTSA